MSCTHEQSFIRLTSPVPGLFVLLAAKRTIEKDLRKNKSLQFKVESCSRISGFHKGKPSTTRLVALLSAKLLTLGIIQVYLILHSLIRNIVSIRMTKLAKFHIFAPPAGVTLKEIRQCYKTQTTVFTLISKNINGDPFYFWITIYIISYI